nr:YqaE/Pmp3 family membrane protein [Lysinibacillus endophyticus]
MYLIAIFLPPLAVLFCGKPIQALINFGLCFFFWIPAVIHAILVVKDKKADERMKRQVKLMKNLEK